jgi:hypothetical protein
LYAPQGNLFGDFYGWMFTIFQWVAYVGLALAVYLLWKKKRSLTDKATIMMLLTSLAPFLGLMSGSLLSIVMGPGFGSLYHHRLYLVVTWMFAAGLLAHVFNWAMKDVDKWYKLGVQIAVVVLIAFAVSQLFFGAYEDSLHHELENTIAHIPCEGVTVVHESPFSGAPAIVYDHYMECGNKHIILSDLTPTQGRTAGYDAWRQENIYWNLALPQEDTFYYIKSEEPLSVIPEEWQTEVYADDGIWLMKVVQGGRTQ